MLQTPLLTPLREFIPFYVMKFMKIFDFLIVSLEIVLFWMLLIKFY